MKPINLGFYQKSYNFLAYFVLEKMLSKKCVTLFNSYTLLFSSYRSRDI